MQLAFREANSGWLLRIEATDSQGRFAIPDARPGLYSLEVTSPHSSHRSSHSVELNPLAYVTPLQITSGRSPCGLGEPRSSGCTRPTLQVGHLAGRLIDPNGAAIPGAGIYLFDERGDEFDWFQADANGHFGPLRLPVGGYQMLAHSSGFSSFRAAVTITPTGVSKLLEVEMSIDGACSKLIH